MTTKNIEDLDRILNELEDLARSDLESSRLFAVLIERLQITLDAQHAALLLPVDGGTWIPIASSGSDCDFVQPELARQLAAFAPTAGAEHNQEPSWLTGSHGPTNWFAAPIRPRRFSKGCLVVCVDGPLPESAAAGLLELLAAFAEIVALRQGNELESFLDEYWEKTQQLCQHLGKAKSRDEAYTHLANGLAQTLNAARVSVVSRNAAGGTHVRAVSGVPIANTASQTVRSLRQQGQRVLRSGKPELRHQTTAAGEQHPPAEMNADGTFPNSISTRLSSDHNQHAATTAVTFEYTGYDELIRNATKLPHLLPTIALAWEQHSRWQQLPRPLRALAARPWGAVSIAVPLFKWLCLACVVGLAVWGLLKPYPLIIEAEGIYEPANTRMVYATSDGFIEQLLVDDGDQVAAGQLLLQQRSPALELQIEDIEGRRRGLLEERNGDRIAMNQLNPDSADFLSDQSRLASKILELDIRIASLEEQLQLLGLERERLGLTAPIAGVVVAKDLHRNLLNRPVRRGDPLLSVTDLEGPWQVRVAVADRDSGYVLAHYQPTSSTALDQDHQPGNEHSLSDPTLADRMPSEPPAGDLIAAHHSSRQKYAAEIKFAFDSAPHEQFPARIQWISDQVENRHGEGCTVEIRAATDASIPQEIHAGAGVHAYFRCGNHPMWFVWCRPLIEAAQRRMWFRSFN